MELFAAGAPTLFTPQRAEKEAARARRMETIYHVGQQKAWDGRTVLAQALANHPRQPGGLATQQLQALSKVFSVLMWGELAAWRVSAQLADLLPDHEMRLAATSQAHDEARHYFVLHDYLDALGVEVPPLDRHTRSFLNACMSAPDPLQKVVGMQMFVETIALTIFKMVRQMNVDPALSELLVYYERDEARHVGFGIQAAPSLMAKTSALGRARLVAFEVRVLSSMLLGMKSMEDQLRLLGADPRTLLEEGGQRFAHIVDEYRQEAGTTTAEGQLLARLYEGVLELAFPETPGTGVIKRVRNAAAAVYKTSHLG